MFKNLFLIRNTLREVPKRYAGHSKWANIKHTKGLKDKERGSLFTKLSRYIKVAIKEGGSADPKLNIKLEQVLEQAKRANMPAATIQSVIKSSQSDKSQCKMHTLEIKGPGSCIILCDVFTDQPHVLKQNIATILKKHGSKYTDGSGKHLFEQKGIIDASLPNVTLEMATDHAIECGAEDVTMSDDTLQFICGASNLRSVLVALEKVGYNVRSGSVENVAVKCQALDDDQLETCFSLYEKLEACPEVIKLSDNIA